MKIYCTQFNFCRDHLGLKKKRKMKLGKEYTCKRMGKTRTIWPLRELLNYTTFEKPTN